MHPQAPFCTALNVTCAMISIDLLVQLDGPATANTWQQA